MSQEGYKLVQDLTEKVKEMIQRISGYTPQIQVLKAELLIGPDWEGGHDYYVKIIYEIDGVQYQVNQRIYANLTETLRDLLFSIVDFYERMHIIKL
jgi:hypothetical protein